MDKEETSDFSYFVSAPPLSIPPDLDKAVDACYGKKVFSSDAKRVAFLFDLYDDLVKK